MEAPHSIFRDDRTIKSHLAYVAAKAGNVNAAIRLVSELAGPLKARLGRFDQTTIFVAPHAKESTGDNAIPIVLSAYLAEHCSALLDDEIVQVSRVYHTGADAMQRLIAPAVFEGQVVPDGRYVLVDDVMTLGGTIADLASYIQEHGGRVVGVVTLVDASRSGSLVCRPKVLREIEERFGDEVRQQFGIEPSALTAEEAGYLIGFRSAEEIRGRAAKAAEERRRRLRSKGIRVDEMNDSPAPPSAGPGRSRMPMTKTNPLLRDDEFVAYSEIRPEHVLPAVRTRIAQYRERIEALVADVGQHRFDRLMLGWEECEDALNRCFAPVGHLHSVCDTPELRAVYGEAIELLADFGSEIGQHAGLCAAVRAIRAQPEFERLPATARKLVDDALLDFRLAGVDLPAQQQKRHRAIETELSRLATEFEQAVLDATEAWTLDLPAGDVRLAGLPESALALLRQAAQEAAVSGLRISLQAPVYQALMLHADDRALRELVYTAYQTRASDQGPDAGRFDNGERIERILALRHEAAQLLGFANAAEESLATKMAQTPQRVLQFLHQLAERAKPVAEREIVELAAFARARLGIETLQPWDLAYASEKLRIERYALSEEELKPYFPLERVMAGLYALTERVFGVRLVERSGVDLWHRDARCFDLIDARGEAFAVVFLDLFARGGKRGGAWMDVARSRKCIGELQRPMAFLTCNFAPPSAELPSLLTHDDVLTLFHEFGHGLHHLLTEIDYPSLAGIEGVEWDAVELPSQFLENFGWHRETLDLVAAHWRNGEALPQSLFQRMLAARHFQAGLFLVRQLEFALFDFRLHLDYDPARGGRVPETLAAVRAEVAVLPPPPWQRFAHSFTHVFAGGYGAGYYSYLWAEVLSADAFARFEAEGILNADTGRAFRAEVLAVGGARPALQSFVAFRGREPDPAALLRSYGLAA